MIARNASSRLFSTFITASVACLLLLAAAPAWGDTYTFTEDTTIDPNDTTYDGHDIIVDGCTVTIDGAHPFNSLGVINAGVVTHSPNADTQVYTLDLTIATDVSVEAGSRIDVNGKGYSSTNGPGQGNDNAQYGAGAGYGGNGGSSTGAAGGAAYGAILQPTDIGSGGGEGIPAAGGAGGGAILLDVGGTLLVNGDITADGADGATSGSNWGGGGSGGSVYVTVGTLAGTGTVSAIGGDSALLTGSGGGGGGRIALYADTDSFQGSTPAYGGAGYVQGGAGTVYFKETAAASGVLLLDNNSVAGAWTPLTAPEPFDLALRHAAIGAPAEAMAIGDLMINQDSLMKHASEGPGIDLTVLGDATIDPNAAIDVTGRGYGSSSGPGEGGDHSQYGAGAGYGGAGANSTGAAGGTVYGSLTEPTDLGSGGGRTDTYQQGGAGGGAIHLDVAGTLTLNGELIADGNPGGTAGSNWGGGGSGGSIYVEVDTLEGTGGIQANGGSVAAAGAGGGGGGRIAVHYDTANNFGGTMTAYGGGLDRFGGAGTIYIKQTAGADGDLHINNNANMGADTDLPAAYPTFGLVRVENGGVLAVTPTETLTALDLEVLAGGVVKHDATEAGGIHLDVIDDATIALDGKIDVSGCGFGSRSGPGAGGDGPNHGCGAGHGGIGGRSADSSARGVAYGDFEQPDTLGSGGGADSDGHNRPGGAGGGVVRLSVGNALVIDGQILADGLAGSSGSENGGGGSGGSVWISADDVTGAGVISAVGGAGGSLNVGGGGSGGRIAIYATTDAFTGTVTACGGAGYEVGGAGSIYVESGGSLGNALIIDNCANAGSWTELPGVTQISNNLIVRNAAQLTHSGNLAVDGDLAIATDGKVNHHYENTDGLSLSVAGNVDIDASGLINLSSRGYAPRNGPGAGESTTTSGAGGGHGGPGGDGSNTAGGSTNGSFVEPTELGSGGGEETDTPNGGRGGGAVHLSVTGTLSFEGSIFANGGNGGGGGSSDNGGGAGGSVWIDVDTLTGAGTISANGGNGGAGVLGGAGGGGRIALHTNTNAFTGTMTACGGTGHNNGGAGTIYVDLAAGVGSALILDNCGTSGAETDLPDTTTVENNVIVRNNAGLTHIGDLTIHGDLTVETNGYVTQPHEQGASHLVVAGDATIDVGGSISVSGRGHAPRNGPGAGGSSTNSGAGGGYGGTGGDGSNTTGGTVYGSTSEPNDLGSGGGEETDGPFGGRGGGAYRLSVTGTLTIDGELLANGGNGTGATNQDNGGGSGGSIWLTAGMLTGNGTISANGGNGGAGVLGGGGGGGRIAIYCDDTAGYSGTILAHAGTGYQSGGAGTIYTETSAQTYGDVLYDNGAISGAWTPFTETDPFAYTIANGAIVYPTEPLGVRSIHVASDGLLTHQSQDDNFFFQIEEDVTVDAGGAIAANGRGYDSSNGPGQGEDGSTFGAGAGHGGAGGDSSQAGGGGTYGMENKPLEFGSGGGNGVPYTNGGNGGGILAMIIGGTLQVDGELAVNGGAGWNVSGNYGGGGSGGSIRLKANTVDGTGVITANGGDGGYANSGGGGGGRIAIYTCDLLMPMAQITATGGTGYQNGSDGTIYFGSSSVDITQQPAEQVVALGETAEFHVVATGDGTLSYQWRRNGVDLVDDGRITGSQTPDLSIADIEFCDVAGYDVIVTDDCGGFPSDTARLYVWNSGDLDGDADIDLADLAQLLGNYGITSGATWDQGDLDGDGDVDLADLAALLAGYGTVCE